MQKKNKWEDFDIRFQLEKLLKYACVSYNLQWVLHGFCNILETYFLMFSSAWYAIFSL